MVFNYLAIPLARGAEGNWGVLDTIGKVLRIFRYFLVKIDVWWFIHLLGVFSALICPALSGHSEGEIPAFCKIQSALANGS